MGDSILGSFHCLRICNCEQMQRDFPNTELRWGILSLFRRTLSQLNEAEELVLLVPHLFHNSVETLRNRRYRIHICAEICELKQ